MSAVQEPRPVERPKQIAESGAVPTPQIGRRPQSFWRDTDQLGRSVPAGVAIGRWALADALVRPCTGDQLCVGGGDEGGEGGLRR
jgi:hypothetical protein